jgi:hypothetical protein
MSALLMLLALPLAALATAFDGSSSDEDDDSDFKLDGAHVDEESEEEGKHPLSPKRNTIFKNYLNMRTSQIIDKTKKFELYEKLFLTKAGRAVVPLEGNHCSGCHMTVTPATLRDAKLGAQVVSCEQCGRIVYALPE